MPEKKKQLRENLGSLILAVHNYGCKYAPTTRNYFLLKNLKAHFFYQKTPEWSETSTQKDKNHPYTLFFVKKIRWFFVEKKNLKFFWKKIVTGKKLMIFLVKKLMIFLKKVKIRLRIKTPKKIHPYTLFFVKKIRWFFVEKKNLKFFWKKIVTGKKLMIFLVKKLMIFLKKVKIRLRIKTPKKIFRLRRAFFRGHLKKSLSVGGRRSALRASRRKIYYFVVGNSGQFRLGEHTTANGRGSTTFSIKRI